MQCPDSPTPAGKESSGSLLSRMLTLRRTSRPDVLGSEDNSSKVVKPGTYIGKSSLPSPPKALLPQLLESSEMSTQNSLDLKLQVNMSGKKILESQEPNLNSEQSLLESTQRPTGNPFGPPPSPVSSWIFPRIAELQVIVPCEVFDQTMMHLSQWRESVTSSGDPLVQVKVVAHGTKLAWKLTARIPERNSGAGTKLKAMLSLMNFEEVSTYHTCCAGSIVIRSEWKLKEAQCLSALTSFGSRRT